MKPMSHPSNHGQAPHLHGPERRTIPMTQRGAFLTAPSPDSIQNSHQVVKWCGWLGLMLVLMVVVCLLIPVSIPTWAAAACLGVLCLPVIKAWQTARAVEAELNELQYPYHAILSICADQANCGRLAVVREFLSEPVAPRGSFLFEAGIGLTTHEGRLLARLVQKYLNEGFQVANVVPMHGRHVMVAVHPVVSPEWKGKIVAILGEWRSARWPSREVWGALRQLGEKVVELNCVANPKQHEPCTPTGDSSTVKLMPMRTLGIMDPLRPAA